MLPKITRMQLLEILAKHNINQNSLVLNAFSQAIRSHRNQTRDDGSDYLEQHIYPVTAMVVWYCEETDFSLTPELIASSLLHDVIEDDVNVDEEKFKDQFGEVVYLEASDSVKIIKLSDRLNNLMCLHTSPIPGKKQRYIKDTKKNYLPLAKDFHWFYAKYLQVLENLED